MTKARDLANAGTALTSVSATELGYLDGVTSAVQTQMNAKLETTTASTTYQSLANNNTAGKNAIINGGMDIWQRGTSFIGTGYNYCADRFMCFRASFAAGMTVSRQTSAQTGFQYAMRIARDSGNTSTLGMTVNNALETSNSIPFAGKTIVLSYYARVGANYSGGTSFSLTLFSGTGTDQTSSNIGGWTGVSTVASNSPTLTTTFQRFSVSATVGASITQLGLSMGYTPSGTAGANDWVEITGIQLELGATATTFSRTGGDIQGELAACQRYYTRFTVDSTFDFMATGLFPSTTTGRILFPLPVQMRIAPTLLDTGGAFALSDGAVSYTATSPTIGSATPNQGTVNFTTSGVTQFRPCILVSDNNASTYVGFNSDL